MSKLEHHNELWRQLETLELSLTTELHQFDIDQGKLVITSCIGIGSTIISKEELPQVITWLKEIDDDN